MKAEGECWVPGGRGCVCRGGDRAGCCDDGVVLEQEIDILQRASYVNQARVHMGYHYPRSLVTAFRSLANFPKFIKDFDKAIKNDFDTKVLNYCTSADVTKDKSRVVGYTSALIGV